VNIDQSIEFCNLTFPFVMADKLVKVPQVCKTFPLGGSIQRHVFDLTQYLVNHEHSVSWAGNYGATNIVKMTHSQHHPVL